MQISDGFLSAARRGALPLLVWAAHFAFAYLLVALGCRAGLDALRIAGLPVMTWLLLLVSLAALAGLGWLGAVSAVEWRRTIDDRETLAGVRLAAAVLGWIGVFWTLLPILLLPLCKAAG
jgi:hypothetical protein